ncbi:MAG TPA: diacylglycerol kinase family protein [Candidatus Acidoferrum sp.]|nr:diacylglycerol kinase family protein [Candidatus Acidoferrum sp.]
MIALIFNPAKNTQQFNQALSLLAAKDLACRVYQTRSRTDIAAQTRTAVTDGADLVVACGGDGTLLWVLNALVGSNVPLAILPIGCSNDFAKQLGIHSIDDAVHAIAGRRYLDVDLGECTFHDAHGQPQQLYFNSTAGLGILANIFALERYAWVEWSKKVFKDAIWPVLCVHALFKTQPAMGTRNIDGESCEGVMPLVEITKTAANGGFVFIGSASPVSGRLHAWYIQGASRMTLLRTLWKVITGKPYIDGKTVCAADCISFEAKPSSPYPVHLNGDLVGQTPAIFRMSATKMQIAALRHEA